MGYSPTVGKSITVNYESKDGATIAVGPKRKNDKLVYLSGDLAMFAAGTGRNPWFAHFIEFGTSGIGRFKKKGRTRYREDQPARPFMRPAFEETKEEMMENFKTSVWESITKYLNKKLKK
jgi:HK97 gp10 family phage protein